jgi:acyl-CoA thioesterase
MSFCAPAGPGDIAIDVELLRSGKSLLHAQARISQDDHVCAVLIGAYGASRPSPVRQAGERAPTAPAPESLERLPFIEGVMPTFTKHFDYRWTSANMPFTAGHQGQISGWVKPSGVASVDTAVLAALTDSFPAPVLPLMPVPAPTSTATWLVNFVGEPGDAPADQYWQFDATTVTAADGYANVEARLWDASGALRVISRQLVAEFSR